MCHASSIATSLPNTSTVRTIDVTAIEVIQRDRNFIIWENFMGLSLQHLLIAAVVAILFLGKGTISDLLGEIGQGVKRFKDGLREDKDS